MPFWLPAPIIGEQANSSTIITLKKQPSFVIMEFLGNADSRLIKARLQSLGFIDVSPIWGHEKGVRTFFCKSTASTKRSNSRDAEMFQQWPIFRDAIINSSEAQNADWYIFSGHHGATLAENIPLSEADIPKFYNETQEVGFFNEPYHTGEWDGQAPLPNSIFMISTVATSKTGPLPLVDNPFPQPVQSAKGIICTACNTLTYRQTRIWLRKTFPNAVVFAQMSTTMGGKRAMVPFAGGSVDGTFFKGALNEDFWRNPTRELIKGGVVQSKKVAQLCRDINMKYLETSISNYPKADIGIMVQDRIFFWSYKREERREAVSKRKKAILNGQVKNLKFDFKYA